MTSMANCYWITLYNVPNLPGNKFVNGLILGVAEMSSGVFSGLMMIYLTTRRTFVVFTIVGILFGGLNQFLVPQGSLISYITLFLSIQGVGGCFNCCFILISSSVPTKYAGSAFTLIMSAAILAALGVPMIVLMAQPLPFIILFALMAANLLII